MPKTPELLEQAKRHLYANYRPAPVVFSRGQGCELFDVDGRRFLDLCAGVAVSALGHGHPALTRAIAEQAGSLVHASNYFYNEPNVRLAVELCARTKMDRAFFCNSGAEANEALLKLARRHFFAQGDEKRQRVVAFHNAFHGRTLGALAMTGTPKYREGFGDFRGVTHVSYGELGEAKAAMGPDVAAVIVETVQGEGGVFPAPAGFLAGLRKLCDGHGALLFVDEVQTGIGRVGRFLGSEGTGANPDAVSLAKGLGGGVPIGAMLTKESLAGALPPGTHGSTFGGNALSCAAALAVLDVIDRDKLVEGARTKGEALAKMLDALVVDLPGVCELARGEGLLRGLLLRPGFVARDVLVKTQEAGILLTAAGERVLRFTPPLVVTHAQLEEGVRVLRGVLEGLRPA
jgi:acetylornithine/N-succinyldiaminopimelate aminotransferase